MVLSLLSSRLLSRFVTRSLVSAPRLTTAGVSLTRTPVAAPRLFATAAASTATARKSAAAKTTAKKPAAKKATATKKKPAAKPKVKAKAKPKRKVAAKKKTARPSVRKTVKKPVKVTLKPSDKPPKRPATPYFLFFRKYIQGIDFNKGESPLKAMTVTANQAGATWRALNDAEKQVFHSEHAVLNEQYKKDREAYFAKVEPRILRELNKRRVAKGKPRLHKHNPAIARRPTTSFFRYLREFRATQAADGNIMQVAKDAGANWRAMTPAQHKPYVDAYHADLKTWHARQPTAQ